MFSRVLTGPFSALLGAIVASSLVVAQPRASVDKPDKWEKDIAAFESQDARQPPAKRAVLFVGSSSIRLWDLKQSFPGLATVNRGFGGSELADSVRYARRIVIPHEPRVVVLYAGDNDIANGKSPERVLDDFRQFVAVIRDALPQTKIVYIGIKPSIKRWALIAKIRQANRLIRQHIGEAKSEQLVFVDIEKPMLAADGRPRADLLQDDGLHLNEQGYAIWAGLLRRAIEPAE